MFRNIFNRMADIQTFGIVSICLFVAVFTGAIALAALMKKPLLKTMSDLPLNDDEPGCNTKGNSHE